MSNEEQVNSTEEKMSVSTSDDYGEDISPDKDKGVFKKILVAGSGSETPMTGDEVFVHYTGRLLNGDVFDSSVERNEKFKFKMGQGQVIKGWDVGVATMTRGEKCILTCAPEYAYGESGSGEKIGPNETLQFEVELFDWMGEDITGDGGVVKNIITKGDGYSTPEDGATVEAHIRGIFNEKVFEEGDVSFEYGEGSEKGVVAGVEQAIGKMSKKESARITVKPEYAYGEEGCEDFDIPGGAKLVYEVRLNNFVKVKEAWEYDTLEERLADSTHMKERGGKYFKDGKYELAKKMYTRGADLITDTSIRKEETKEAAKPLRVALHLNIAACHLKLDAPNDAIKECEEVLIDDNENVKALFRRGQAHVSLQNLEEAVESFQKVTTIEPTNKAAKNQLILTRNKIKNIREREKKRYANMFEKLAASSANEEPKPEKPVEVPAENLETPAENLVTPAENLVTPAEENTTQEVPMEA